MFLEESLQMFWKRITKFQRLKYRRNYNFSLDDLLSDFGIQPKNCLQIGANSGQEIPTLLKHSRGSVLAFEPLIEPFRELERNYQSERIELFNFAVGNMNCKLEINVASNNGQSSSFLKPKKHLETNPEIYFNEKEKVEMIRLDDFFQDVIPDFWILDTQGYELEILKGASESISHAKWVVTEIHRKETYEGCAQIEELDRWMKSHGFKRIATHWYEIWGDALYSR
jgi:FkbM family methyltransferase